MAQNILPLLNIKNDIVLPKQIKEFKISTAPSLKLIKVATENFKKQMIINMPGKLGEFGVLCKIISQKTDGKSGLNIIVEGISMVEINFVERDEDLTVDVSFFEVCKPEGKLQKRKMPDSGKYETLRDFQMKILSQVKNLPFALDEDEMRTLDDLSDVDFLYRVLSFLPINPIQKMEIAIEEDINEAYLLVNENLMKMAEASLMPKELTDTKNNIQGRVNSKIQKQQKEFYLREQIKAAQDELDELTGQGSEFDELRKRVEKNKYPEHIKKKALYEIKRLEQTPAQAQEANITRQYIETLLDLPYWQKDEENVDIAKAKKVLDKDHYGLEKPKSKIIEFLAVKQQNPDAKGSILALVGPPGTGKTTMAKSIANSLGRKFVKISLGGVKDESEIRGHRRTYIASQPGKIIQGMKKAGVVNPIILLDEIDKMSSDFKGDPSSAMLEVLDYEQNKMFQDHYIEEEYDLSNATFIATANYYNDIPEALIDRLDIVEVSSYTEIEKIQIFKKHILKRVLEETKIPKGLFKWTDPAIKDMIKHFTIEAGVRQLNREVNTVARKILVKKLNGELEGTTLTITPELLVELLGPKKYDYTKIDKEPQVGAVMGLAWTSVGGDILPIEVNLFPGKGDVIITGQLKDVMRESATIALSYIKTNADKFGITPERLKELEEMNIHIHSPDGATPKDGPSAGVTFTTALISTITGRSVSQFIGMTGEISLRGNVLPIGGLKEKSISAFRSGLKQIFIPHENIKDLEEIPAEVKKKLKITPVEHYTEIYKVLFK